MKTVGGPLDRFGNLPSGLRSEQRELPLASSIDSIVEGLGDGRRTGNRNGERQRLSRHRNRHLHLWTERLLTSQQLLQAFAERHVHLLTHLLAFELSTAQAAPSAGNQIVDEGKVALDFAHRSLRRRGSWQRNRGGGRRSH